jgi:hypothetical protein
MASIDRTAYPVYRRTPSFVELERHYTLTAEERNVSSPFGHGSRRNAVRW